MLELFAADAAPTSRRLFAIVVSGSRRSVNVLRIQRSWIVKSVVRIGRKQITIQGRIMIDVRVRVIRIDSTARAVQVFDGRAVIRRMIRRDGWITVVFIRQVFIQILVMIGRWFSIGRFLLCVTGRFLLFSWILILNLLLFLLNFGRPVSTCTSLFLGHHQWNPDGQR